MPKVKYFLEQDLVFVEKSKDSQFQDLTGQKFARLTVLGFAGQRFWYCRCECLNVTKVMAGNLKNSHTMSCGCFNSDKITTHGHVSGYKKSPTYKSWQSMLNRCQNSKNEYFKDYGGRGIKVCQSWQKFENFLADMGERPEGKTLDRYPDNNGNYSPENCRWATKKEQQNNRRNSIFLTYEGKTQTMGQWEVEKGMCKSTLRSRIIKLGWPIEKAFTYPVKQKLK